MLPSRSLSSLCHSTNLSVSLPEVLRMHTLSKLLSKSLTLSLSASHPYTNIDVDTLSLANSLYVEGRRYCLHATDWAHLLIRARSRARCEV